MTPVHQHKVFPRLSGQSLTKRRMVLPEDFEGDVNLVMVAFRRQHQAIVDLWLHHLGDLEEGIEGLAIYEVPLLIRYPRFYRRWIDEGMRSGISDPETRDRTITVYTDRRRFLDHVDLPDESRILVTLLDDEGNMVWTHTGAPTKSALEELSKLLGHTRASFKDR